MIKETPDGLLINIRIIPNSSKNGLFIESECIKIKITAPPVDNKANKALIEFLSKLTKIPKTSIIIIRGETSKDKVLLFKTNSPEKNEYIKMKLFNKNL